MTTAPSARPRRTAAKLAAILCGTTLQITVPALAATSDTAAALDVAGIVAKAAPSIVSVETGHESRTFRHLPNEAFLENFAERFVMPFPKQFFEADLQPVGYSTGVVVSDDGRILTRADALEDSTTVRVTLDDGRQLDAAVVGYDEMTDLAVLKVEATDLPALPFAVNAETGEPVVALGAKFGDRRSVSSGVVSGIGEDGPQAALFDLIETDATVGWGNWGGLLLNGKGEIVGVNAQHIGGNAMASGMNVAVPSKVASAVLADISDDGRMDRGFLGVQITPVSDDVAAALGLDDSTGAFVVGVGEGSPAATAGLQRGDIVLSVNGADIRTPRDLTRSIAGDRPGSEVTIQLLRAGQPTTLSVTLGNRSA